MYYCKDISQHFNLTVPRTQDEYAKIAATANNEKFSDGNTRTILIGSCVGRRNGCSGAYSANLVLSSMTQTLGYSQGHMFDTKDMKPLMEDALNLEINHLEDQVRFRPCDGKSFF